jgi:hypothetical protein
MKQIITISSRKYSTKRINDYNLQLGFYLAGLIEGNGNIWTSKTLRSSKGRINNPQITFTFHLKEKPFFNK